MNYIGINDPLFSGNDMLFFFVFLDDGFSKVNFLVTTRVFVEQPAGSVEATKKFCFRKNNN